ncbi:MAG: permease-like cell division protein FtsX [Candidatus Dormibacteraeota bacterium]|nr:permease-like cell division protein FtsX [Candidatus Dormibacteraeota bacterium]
MGELLIGPRPPRWRTIKVVTRNAGRYLLGSAIRNWLRNIGSTAPALGSMSLLLLLVGLAVLGGLVGQNIASTEARDASVLHLYLRDDANSADINSLETQLGANKNVQYIVYVSKVQALARAQHRPGLPELANASESNPFPASLDVHVVSVDKVGTVDAAFRHDPVVDSGVPSSYDPTAYRSFQQVLFWVAAIGIAFLLLLAFIAVTVTANSIRSAILSRGDEIGIMQLVGAPLWMVRGPFVIEGALTGAAAGGLAGILALIACFVAVQAGAANFAQVAPGLTIQAGLVIGLMLLFIGPILARSPRWAA